MKKNLLNAFETFSPHSHSVSLQNFTLSKSVAKPCFGLFESLAFEKKLVRSAYKKQFGRLLPSAATISISLAHVYAQATLNKRETSKGFETRSSVPQFLELKQKKKLFNLMIPHPTPLFTPFGGRGQGKGGVTSELSRNAPFATLDDQNLTQTVIKSQTKESFVKSALPRKQKALKTHFDPVRGLGSGLQFMGAHWALEKLSESLKRSGAKTVLNVTLRDIKSLMDQLQSSCALKGLRITASGRLSKRKKGLAQQITVSVGKVPASSFSERVDYSQGFIKTSRGVVGLKLWLAFN